MKNYTVYQVGLINNSKVFNENNSFSGYSGYYGYSGNSFNTRNYSNNSNYNNIYSDYNFINNLSNVCYINSSIQCLFHLKKFVNFIAENSGNSLLLRATRNLLIDMINSNSNNYKNKNLSVHEIKEAMAKVDNRYKYNNQEDANEFISNFLNALLDEISDKSKFKEIYSTNIRDKIVGEAYIKFYNKYYKRKGKSFLLDLFYGNFITEKYCKNCNVILSVKFNAFNMLELPIYELSRRKKYYSSLTLDEILNSYFSESKIYDDFCEKCNGEVYSRSYIYKLPETLIIYFARSANEEYVNNMISYKKELELSKYLYKEAKYESRNYNLDCVIEHSGNSDFGHYTSLCQIKQDVWYYFSDTIYKLNRSGFNSENAIILLYKSYN